MEAYPDSMKRRAYSSSGCRLRPAWSYVQVAAAASGNPGWATHTTHLPSVLRQASQITSSGYSPIASKAASTESDSVVD